VVVRNEDREINLDLTNNETFKSVYLLCFCMGVCGFFCFWYIFKRKNKDVYAKKSTLIFLIIGNLPILILIWILPNLSFYFKGGVTILMAATELVYLYALNKGGKNIRRVLGVENEEDRYEKEKKRKQAK
jgi:amino acid transporter